MWQAALKRVMTPLGPQCRLLLAARRGGVGCCAVARVVLPHSPDTSSNLAPFIFGVATTMYISRGAYCFSSWEGLLLLLITEGAYRFSSRGGLLASWFWDFCRQASCFSERSRPLAPCSGCIGVWRCNG